MLVPVIDSDVVPLGQFPCKSTEIIFKLVKIPDV